MSNARGWLKSVSFAPLAGGSLVGGTAPKGYHPEEGTYITRVSYDKLRTNGSGYSVLIQRPGTSSTIDPFAPNTRSREHFESILRLLEVYARGKGFDSFEDLANYCRDNGPVYGRVRAPNDTCRWDPFELRWVDHYAGMRWVWGRTGWYREVTFYDTTTFCPKIERYFDRSKYFERASYWDLIQAD